MDWTNKIRITLCLTFVMMLSACSVSYKFNGASIDYSKVKGARVIIFDDVATTGETSADFIRRLEECGAKVIGKVFLANSYFWKVHQKEKEGQP